MSDNFCKEKLFLTQCFANEADVLFVYDKDLDYEIRKIIARLTKQSTREEKKLINDELRELFDKYKLAIIRAILVNINFLNYADKLDQQFEDIFIKTKEFISINPQYLNALLFELDYFSQTRLKSNQEFILLLIKTLSLKEETIKQVLYESEYNPNFKFIVFKLGCSEKTLLPLLVKYLIFYFKEYSYLAIEINHLIKEYAKTGEDGFEIALKYHLRGKFLINGYTNIHANNLISSFSVELFDWVNKTQSKAYELLIEPILVSLNPLKITAKREILIKHLLNYWYPQDQYIGEKIIERIKFRLISDNKFLDLFLEGVRTFIQRQVVLAKNDLLIRDKIQEIRRLASASKKNEIQAIFKEASSSLLFYSMLTPDRKFTVYIFDKYIKSQAISDWASNEKNRWYEFADKICRPGYFQQLPQKTKHALVSVHPFKKLLFQEQLKILAPYCSPKYRETHF